MVTKSLKLSVWVLLVAAGVGLAQEKPEPGEKREGRRGREDRAPRLNQAGIRNPEKLLEQMKEELKLTDSQQSEAKKLVDEYAADVKTLRESAKPPAEMGSKYAEWRKQLDEARAAKDNARMQQILDQMKEDRKQRDAAEAPIREAIDKSTKNLHDRLATMLGEKQKAGFEGLWQDAVQGRNTGPARVNPNQLRSVVMKLPDLADDQKKKVEDLFKASEKEIADAKTPVDRNRVSKKLYDDVFAVLNPAQQEKVKGEMNSRGPRGRGGEDKPAAKGG
ncbi:MAG: Spy/CpxP family protein refolding chaperone [Planctomycetes bacterium]|nr:Spy/CpxP family protein refolding chaperone [Planctomycetota bacterium]